MVCSILFFVFELLSITATNMSMTGLVDFAEFWGITLQRDPTTGLFYAGGFLKEVRSTLGLRKKRWYNFARKPAAINAIEAEKARGVEQPFVESLKSPRGMFVTVSVMTEVLRFVCHENVSEVLHKFQSMVAPPQAPPPAVPASPAVSVAPAAVSAGVVQRIVEQVMEKQQEIRLEERRIASAAHMESYKLVSRLKDVTKQQRKAWREADILADTQWILLRRISDQHKRLKECGAPVMSLVPTVYRRVEGIPEVQFDFLDGSRDTDAEKDEEDEARFAKFLKEGMEAVHKPKKQKTK